MNHVARAQDSGFVIEVLYEGMPIGPRAGVTSTGAPLRGVW
jgi:hypothetical protein